MINLAPSKEQIRLEKIAKLAIYYHFQNDKHSGFDAILRLCLDKNYDRFIQDEVNRLGYSIEDWENAKNNNLYSPT